MCSGHEGFFPPFFYQCKSQMELSTKIKGTILTQFKVVWVAFFGFFFFFLSFFCFSRLETEQRPQADLPKHICMLDAFV